MAGFYGVISAYNAKNVRLNDLIIFRSCVADKLLYLSLHEPFSDSAYNKWDDKVTYLEDIKSEFDYFIEHYEKMKKKEREECFLDIVDMIDDFQFEYGGLKRLKIELESDT